MHTPSWFKYTKDSAYICIYICVCVWCVLHFHKSKSLDYVVTFCDLSVQILMLLVQPVFESVLLQILIFLKYVETFLYFANGWLCHGPQSLLVRKRS